MGDMSIITLPVACWSEFRQLRLEVLRDSPQAFGSSFEREVAYPVELWMGRLWEAEERRSVALFAEHDGELVGMIGAYFEVDSQVATVVAVFVKPDFRGRGIGKRLVGAVLERLREIPGTEKAKLIVNVEQTPAVELYHQAGFVEVETERVPRGDGRVYDELILERSL